MPKNIKKKSASHIYYGTHRTTGDLLYTDDVPSGKRCECNCTYCNQPLEARKGKIRRHHFAHISNYECMYAGEVAIYKAFADLLESIKQITLPSKQLRFPSWHEPEIIQDSRKIIIDSVVFECTELAYPPILKVVSQGYELRIILDFNHYYTEEDQKILSDEAEHSGYALLTYHLPKIDDHTSFAPPQLNSIIMKADNAEWWFSQEVARWKKRYETAAFTPSEHGHGYLCPISIDYYKGKYSARWVDCAYCRFNIAEPPLCRCLAKAGIKSKDDFKRSPEERFANIEKIRIANETNLNLKTQIDNLKRRPWVKPSVETSPSERTSVPSSQPDLQAEYEKIQKTFNPEAIFPTIDRFNRRWIQCEVCGHIKRDIEIINYDNKRPNLGLCSACSRKKSLV